MPTLEWIGKSKVVNHHLAVPYHVLEKQYTFGEGDADTNRIIHGDNLLALKSLLPEYEGRVKCIYIDKRIAYLIQANERENSPKALDIRGFGELLISGEPQNLLNRVVRRKNLARKFINGCKQN